MNSKNNNVVWIAVVIGGLLFAVVLGGNFVIDKIANRVIQKLQKEYSPSPYGPGIDPDRLDPEKFKPR